MRNGCSFRQISHNPSIVVKRCPTGELRPYVSIVDTPTKAPPFQGMTHILATANRVPLHSPGRIGFSFDQAIANITG